MKPDSTAVCAGVLTNGGLNATTTMTPGLGTVQSVEAGGAYACAIQNNNTLKCWGGYADGGYPLGKVKAVSAGAVHACAILSDDTVMCWWVINLIWPTKALKIAFSIHAACGVFHSCGLTHSYPAVARLQRLVQPACGLQVFICKAPYYM